MNNLYNTLGIDRTASPDDIKRAYRKMAAQHHPDRGGNTEKFQEIQAAYDILSDAGKRAQYDNPQPQMEGFPGGFQFHTGGFPPGFEDIFEHAFGGMFRRQQPQRNRSLNLQASISLEDAFNGKDVIANINLPSGKNQTLEIKIPAGIQDGMTIRLNGMGDDSIPNAPKGDLHLTVHIHPHNTFIRQGDDLIQVLKINCLDAIVGKNISIKTIDNKELDVTINPGTQHGQILSLQGYGMPNINDNRMRGRMLINIEIHVPTDLTEQQKDIIKKIIS
jgi:curved DNA-binding protein